MTPQTQPNVIYKDRLFKAIFGRQEHKDCFFLFNFTCAIHGFMAL